MTDCTGSSAGDPENVLEGTVVKLDRGYPLVRCGVREDSPRFIRCEHATALVKGERVRMAIGDKVAVAIPDGHDKGIIREILPRRTTFVRKDPAERTAKQVLAANFQLVIIAEPIVQLNRNRLERELVLAHDTRADVAIVLTKADLLDSAQCEATRKEVADLAGASVPVVITSINDEDSLKCVRKLIPSGTVAILIGKSGVGKSTLVNCLAGDALQQTASVRESDGKGRHTTVDRVMVDLPGGGAIVDMPGVRGLGLWDADQGLDRAFADISALARECRFRDCLHQDEPGCAVRDAVDSGELSEARLVSYRTLAAEIAQVKTRRDEARRLRGEKASDRKRRKS